MSSEDRDESDPLQSLIADVIEAESRGESVDRKALIDSHPEHADSLREFFASHDQMKSAADVDPPTLPPRSSGPASEDPTIVPGASPLDDPTLPPTEPGGDDPTLPPTDGASQDGEPTVGDKVRYFGDYELLDEVARGGMGVVFKARQMNLNRTVALKMILAGQFAGSEDVQRFYGEAEAAAQLDHPGIVPIFEIGHQHDQHYFSMAFIDGDSLQERVREGPLEPREAATISGKITAAIVFAHENHVIHRDLKPANILLDRWGQPKVTDFGLAKQVRVDSGLTQSGAVMGTPSYMSPEQACGDSANVGPLTDVYALGAILYCLLTGRPPFQASNLLETIRQVQEGDPVSPRVLNPNVPLDLETIALKCLEKTPSKRYESAAAFKADLDRYLNDEPILARPPTLSYRFHKSYRKHRAAFLTTGAIFALLIAGLLAMGLMWQRAEVAELEALDSAAKARQAETDERIAREVVEQQREQAEERLARTNYFLAVARWDADRVRDANRLLDKIPLRYRFFEWNLARRQFVGGRTCSGHVGCVHSVRFNPSGTTIASGSDDATVKLWDASTGRHLRTLRGHADSVYRVVFSPDGTRIASGGYDQNVIVWDAENGVKLKALTGSAAPIHAIAFSPDGRQIAVGGGDGDHYNTRLKPVRIWNVDSAEELIALKGHRQTISSLVFSPDGKQITSSDSIWTKTWDVSTGEELKSTGDYKGRLSFSADHSRIAGSRSNCGIRLRATGSNPCKPTIRQYDKV